MVVSLVIGLMLARRAIAKLLNIGSVLVISVQNGVDPVSDIFVCQYRGHTAVIVHMHLFQLLLQVFVLDLVHDLEHLAARLFIPFQSFNRVDQLGVLFYGLAFLGNFLGLSGRFDLGVEDRINWEVGLVPLLASCRRGYGLVQLLG